MHLKTSMQELCPTDTSCLLRGTERTHETCTGEKMRGCMAIRLAKARPYQPIHRS